MIPRVDKRSAISHGDDELSLVVKPHLNGSGMMSSWNFDESGVERVAGSADLVTTCSFGNWAPGNKSAIRKHCSRTGLSRHSRFNILNSSRHVHIQFTSPATLSV